VQAERTLEPGTVGLERVIRQGRERAARSERRSRTWGYLLPFVPLALLAIVWQVYAEQAASLVLPTFTEFVVALVDLLLSPEFWDAMVTSSVALVIGYLASVAVGVPIGLAMGRMQGIRNLVDPYVNLILVTPMAVLMPIVLIAFGITLTARVAVIFVFCLPFVVVPCLAGVRLIDRQLIDMSRTFGSSEAQLWRHVLIPGALPAILTGLRQGLAHGLTGMVVVELTLIAAGVGRLLQTYGSELRYDYVFAIVFAVIAQAVIGVGVLRGLEARSAQARTLDQLG
jgi:NitT/TauT family transport system permease protein